MKMQIGIVTAKFNSDITFKLEEGAIHYLQSLADVAQVQIWAVRVPGAIEIPLACDALLGKGCDGVIALGAVIRGDTAHFEYVVQSVERGLTDLSLRTKKPIGCGVLTVNTMDQAVQRAGGAHGNKGEEAAQAVVEMVTLLRRIRKSKRQEMLDVNLGSLTGTHSAEVKLHARKKSSRDAINRSN